MENATRALTMAASILIAMMVIGIGTYIFNTFSTFSKEEQEKIYEYTITEFNVEFTKYENIQEINIHDIISLANYAKNYNDNYQMEDTPENIEYYISVNIGNEPRTKNIEKMSIKDKNILIKEAIKEDYRYKLKENGIEYSNITGRVKSITFEYKKND